MSNFFSSNPFGEQIFKLRYAFDENETWEQACRRVSDHVARAEATDSFSQLSDEFYDELVNGRFMPGGRIWYGSGRNKAQLINCFVLPAGDSREGWGKLLHDTTVISGTGGGVGTNFSNVRYRNAPIAGTGGFATGPVSLMKMENAVGEEIKGGGGRRAAYMFCLNHDHPDIMEFLDAKLNTTKLPPHLLQALLDSGVKRSEIPDDLLRGDLNNANISIVFMNESPEEFFEKVGNDTDHDLVWQGKVIRTIKARELWNLVVENALKNGEPGVLNGHYANEMNNLHYYADLESTNPCVTDDTWVTTSEGARQVKHLVGKPFTAIVDGKPFLSPTGFVQTGVKPTLVVKTSRGYELKLTGNHRVLVATKQTRKVQKKEWVEAKDLKPGMKIVLHNHREDDAPVDDTSSDFKLGWLLGNLHGDGNLTSYTANLDYWGPSAPQMTSLASGFLKATVGGRSDMNGCIQVKHKRARISSVNLLKRACHYGMNERKGLTESIEGSDIAAGFLRGWFDADGSVQGSLLKGVSVRLTSIDVKSLKAAQRVLLRLGVASTIYPRREAGRKSLPDGKGSYADYTCQAQYELVVANDNLEVFEKRVGFFEPDKSAKLKGLLSQYARNRNRERFVAKVESVEQGPTLPVYDCTVPGAEAFDANGLYVHNCGEIWMQPYSVCCLGSLVLPRFVKVGSKAKDPLDRIDWGLLHDSVSRGVRFLDDVLTVTHYPIPEVEVESKKTRRVGLGIMGLADMFVRLGIRYTSPEAIQVVDRVMAFIKHAAYDTSTYLAVEKGPFPVFEADEFLKSGFVRTLKPSMRAKIKSHGMRNCALLTVAPGGTTSIVQGVWGSGEPFLAPAYKRNFMDADKNVASEMVVMPIFEEYVKNGWSIDHFEGADEVHPEKHFEIQAALQKHVDNSISKTVNIPQGTYTTELLSALYIKYLPQLKGVTIYPEGSRDFTPLERISNQDGADFVIQKVATARLEDTCLSGTCGL